MTSYWIANSGTSQDPLPPDWYGAPQAVAWRKRWGDVAMSHGRPTIKPGDRLVHHAVGSAKLFKTGRIFSVVEVISEPELSGHERWDWQVKHRMLVPGPRLPSCPSVDDIDVKPTSLMQHSHVKISPGQGREAERLIARAADRSGRAGHCYNGPPPPPGFVPGQ
jgi:hypothetical protein